MKFAHHPARMLIVLPIRAFFAFLESPAAVGLLLMLLVVIAMQACATTFDSETAAIEAMERQAYAQREYDRPDVRILYRFVDDPAAACIAAGTPSWYGASSRYSINGCAVLGDVCTIILSFYPTKAEIRHEETHCRFGSWHKGYAVSATGERVK